MADLPKKPRGTAAMDPTTRKEVARKGGLAISRDRARMAALGRIGGAKRAEDREAMAEMGRKGGKNRWQKQDVSE